MLESRNNIIKDFVEQKINILSKGTIVLFPSILHFSFWSIFDQKDNFFSIFPSKFKIMVELALIVSLLEYLFYKML